MYVRGLRERRILLVFRPLGAYLLYFGAIWNILLSNEWLEPYRCFVVANVADCSLIPEGACCGPRLLQVMFYLVQIFHMMIYVFRHGSARSGKSSFPCK